MALADFAAGANNAIQEILKKRLLEQRYQDSLKQQAFQNDLATRGANRADEQLKATTENNRLIREAQQQNTNNARAQQIVDRAEPDTFYADTDPTARMIRGTDYASFLKPVQPTQAMGSDFQGPMPDAETPQQAQVGRQGGFLKMATSTQRMQESQRQDRIADNNRQDAQIAATTERDDKRFNETVRHNTAMERNAVNKPPSVQLITTVGPDGKPVQQFVSKVAGATFEKPAPSIVENRIASAQTVKQTGDDIIASLSKPGLAQALGPAMGRYNSLQDFIGNPPPEFAELAGQIESYALANMGVHGMRSAQGAQQIKDMLSGAQTPESLAAKIRGLNAFSEHFMENEGRGSRKPSAGAEPPAGARVRKWNPQTKRLED